MNRETAQLILQASHPGGESGEDPQMVEALALVAADPALAAWWEQEQRWDLIIRQGMSQVPVPDVLPAFILAGRPADSFGEAAMPVPEPEAEAPAPRGRILRPTRKLPWWRAGYLRELSIACVVIAGVFMLLRPARTGLTPVGRVADYTRAMIEASPLDGQHVTLATTQWPEIRRWLADHHGAADLELPAAMAGATGLNGCRVLDWHGRTVSMLCFRLNGTEHVDLFVTDQQNIRDAIIAARPLYAPAGMDMTVTWVAKGKVYLLAGPVSEQLLRDCLPPEVPTNGTPTAAIIIRLIGAAVNK